LEDFALLCLDGPFDDFLQLKRHVSDALEDGDVALQLVDFVELDFLQFLQLLGHEVVSGVAVAVC
jgi:hypothetical protein